jgi:hypothetical protein
VRQLHAGYGALLVNKADDSSQRLNVIVFSDTEVLRTDATLGKDCGCFGEYQSSTADRPAAEMHEMPVGHASVNAGVLAHGRNKYAIRKCDVPNGERVEKMSHTGCGLSLSMYQF